MHASTRRGFTMVEMLVVIAIFLLLMGIVFTAISGVRRQAVKSEELHALRRIGIAWVGYSNDNDGRLLPGFVSAADQQRWSVRYRYRDRTRIPPLKGDATEDNNVAGMWPWRLMSYVDHDRNVMLAHLPRERREEGTDQERAEEIRNFAAFGYNAFHVGGWSGTAGGLPVRRVNEEGATDERVPLTVLSIATTRRPSGLVTFLSSAVRDPAIYRYLSHRDDNDALSYAMPPNFGEGEVWGRPRSNPQSLYEVELYGAAENVPDT